jgi:hypothetical protein
VLHGTTTVQHPLSTACPHSPASALVAPAPWIFCCPLPCSPRAHLTPIQSCTLCLKYGIQHMSCSSTNSKNSLMCCVILIICVNVPPSHHALALCTSRHRVFTIVVGCNQQHALMMRPTPSRACVRPCGGGACAGGVSVVALKASRGRTPCVSTRAAGSPGSPAAAAADSSTRGSMGTHACAHEDLAGRHPLRRTFESINEEPAARASTSSSTSGDTAASSSAGESPGRALKYRCVRVCVCVCVCVCVSLCVCFCPCVCVPVYPPYVCAYVGVYPHPYQVASQFQLGVGRERRHKSNTPLVASHRL